MAGRHFSTILVANRGEIAIRIMRTARRLGFRTVAVYSDADRDAPHCRAADLALYIGAAPPSQSYLDIGALLAAAAASGADAVHPGYGFLAENPAFAQACADAGLVFVGPGPDAMAAMGNKGEAKRLMQAAGVPCVPGYQGPDQGDAHMMAEAALIGYPVMIKAAAGGAVRLAFGTLVRDVAHAVLAPGQQEVASRAIEHAFDRQHAPRHRQHPRVGALGGRMHFGALLAAADFPAVRAERSDEQFDGNAIEHEARQLAIGAAIGPPAQFIRKR
jgi:acetyl/propionyl-CoA carboxylase alpha subunit